MHSRRMFINYLFVCQLLSLNLKYPTYIKHLLTLHTLCVCYSFLITSYYKSLIANYQCIATKLLKNNVIRMEMYRYVFL